MQLQLACALPTCLSVGESQLMMKVTVHSPHLSSKHLRRILILNDAPAHCWISAAPLSVADTYYLCQVNFGHAKYLKIL